MQGMNMEQIVLASASPRRKEILKKAGYKLIVEKSEVDESKFSTDKIEPWKYAEQLALAKAKDVAPNYPFQLVLGADTIIDYDGEIIGKPLDEKEAEEIVSKLFSKPHKVITGIALFKISDNTEIVTHDVTVVHPKKMSLEQIKEHVLSGTWKGKAGAYAIQETGDEFVEKIEGSMTNVMGLPLELIIKLLNELNTKK